jgi:alpha-L-fucosidase
MEILLYTWGGGGNMLLNIGPMGDGSLNPVEVKRLEQIAKWWKVNGETSIRGSRGGVYYQGNWGVSTKKDNKVYLHIFRWNKGTVMSFPNLPRLNIKSARLLNGKEIELSKGNDTFSLEVVAGNREKIVTTIELTFDKSVMETKPLHVFTPLTYQAKLTASQNQEDLKNVVDGNARTTWKVEKKSGQIWIEATFDKPVTIASVVVGRGDHWKPKNKPELQIPDGNGGWKTVLKWKPKWGTVKFLKEPITTESIRLFVKGTATYNLAEFELYAPL